MVQAARPCCHSQKPDQNDEWGSDSSSLWPAAARGKMLSAPTCCATEMWMNVAFQCAKARTPQMHPSRPVLALFLSPSDDRDFASIFDDQWAGIADAAVDDEMLEMIPDSAPSDERSKVAPLRQSLFSSPLVPLFYEQLLPPLWATGLRERGGMSAEYESVVSYLGAEGGIIADVSCGTDIVGRKMAQSGRYRKVIALDYSSEMLRQLLAEWKERPKGGKVADGARPPSPLSVICGDAQSLPFRDSSLDALYWGAALHCVPNAKKSMWEMHRVLKPGGRMYATTFLRPMPDVVFRFFDLEELEEIAMGAGFKKVDVEVERLDPVYGVLCTVKSRA